MLRHTPGHRSTLRAEASGAFVKKVTKCGYHPWQGRRQALAEAVNDAEVVGRGAAGTSGRCSPSRIGSCRRTARGRADVECSNRPGVRRDHKRPGDNAAVRDCEHAHAQPGNTHRTVAPSGGRAGHRHRTLRVCTIADFGGEAVLMMTIPPIAIVSVPGPTCRY